MTMRTIYGNWQPAIATKLVAITKEPDLDQAVTFYEHARESIARLNTRNDNWLGTGEPLVIPDEASERLEAFELVGWTLSVQRRDNAIFYNM